MKKFFALCLVLVFTAILLAGLCISASAEISPKASTYYYSTVNQDKDTTRITHRYRHSTTKAGGGVEGADDPNSPNYTGNRNPSKGNYDDNEGKDDPNSPNYTGNRDATKDGSDKSPDTSASAPVAGIAALAVCSVAAVTSLSLKKEN